MNGFVLIDAYIYSSSAKYFRESFAFAVKNVISCQKQWNLQVLYFFNNTVEEEEEEEEERGMGVGKGRERERERKCNRNRERKSIRFRCVKIFKITW